MNKYIKIFIVGLVLLTLVGCSTPHPPSASTTVNGKTLSFETGTYSWSDFFSKVQADAVGPKDMFQNEKPVVVSSQSKLPFQFSYQATPNIAAYKVDGNGDSSPLTITGNNIIMPKEKGTYYIHLVSKWNKGTVNYFFFVKVK